jgi:hypothetical protein
MQAAYTDGASIDCGCLRGYGVQIEAPDLRQFDGRLRDRSTNVPMDLDTLLEF